MLNETGRTTKLVMTLMLLTPLPLCVCVGVCGRDGSMFDTCNCQDVSQFLRFHQDLLS